MPTICFGECSECIGGGLGCTDEVAGNYDPFATIDDGSCVVCEEPAVINFNVDASGVVSGDYDNVMINGSWDAFGDSSQYWGSWGVTLTDDDMDGIYSGSLELSTKDYMNMYMLYLELLTVGLVGELLVMLQTIVL